MRKVNKIAIMASGDSAWIGGIQYTMNILHALNMVNTDNAMAVHIFKGNKQNLGDLKKFKNLDLKVLLIDEVVPGFTFSNRVFWFIQRKLFGRINPRFENYLVKNKYDYVYPAVLSDCHGSLNVGSWIADFQYHNYPDGHSKETTVAAEKQISFIASKMKKIVFSSVNAECESYQLFPETVGKSHVMPFAVYINEDDVVKKDLNNVCRKYGIEGPFLMVSNLFGAIKNHKTLFDALGLLKKQGVKIQLVCTGNIVNYAKMEYANEILQFITNSGIRTQLFLLGLIPRQDQVSLYRKSFAMVQPSIHEGWSTCVEEAKALGKTLILSDIPLHREQYPDNPWFFNPLNAADLAKKIHEVYLIQGQKEFPNILSEQKALSNYKKNVCDFGKKFLDIAKA